MPPIKYKDQNRTDRRDKIEIKKTQNSLPYPQICLAELSSRFVGDVESPRTRVI